MLQDRTVLVGVAGGIAAYKAAEIVSRLTRLGADVHVIMTASATRLVSPMTFQAISGNPVATDLFAEPRRWSIEHVALADRAELMLIAPATANIMGKLAAGIADDFLSTTVLATAAPVILAPAMHDKMWRNPIVQANADRLRRAGFAIIEPEYGRLASGSLGQGRLPEPQIIVDAVVQALSRRPDLAGLPVLITAGPTRERIDPVRYLSNFSSGKMGYSLAAAAVERGARVTLVSGPVDLPEPPGVDFVLVESAAEMADEVWRRAAGVQVVVMAAAVADYRPAERAPSKVKRSSSDLVIRLVPNPDIIGELGRDKGNRLLVGFAAETDDLVANARAKLAAKNLDLVCANWVDRAGHGFGTDTNALTLIDRMGGVVEVPLQDKRAVAHAVWDRVRALLGTVGAGSEPAPTR
ncbi:MAG TPA: bifunctional phosphopantothenoylcysteine decarboxylase/phosphopantothenate--cysteine ligase CoaBC [Bacillota bacterium]|nr:bifunctional phosphopantothenoylcysteine decarboxylase/phosphopantothenate--cysteine ligase CoaBC [Bacillota bacterium]